VTQEDDAPDRAPPLLRAEVSAVVRYVIGVLAIAGVLGGLWLFYGPRTPEPSREGGAPVVRLAAADAVVRVRDGSDARRASIYCDGDHRRASGFWADDPVQACDALASTRGALLSGPGCTRVARGRLTIAATGSFGARRFAHRAVRGGCPDPDDWLAVDALATPLLVPDQELEPAG
jgi:hypothetical protein